MKERDFCRRYITPWLKEKGIYYFKPRGGPYSTRRGIPDYALCICGHFIAIEVKSEKNKSSQWQVNEKRMLEEAGGRYFVVRPSNWENVKGVLEEMLDDKHIKGKKSARNKG